MRGVTVPANYKHLIGKERKRTDEYRAQIRRYIVDRPGQTLTSKDFEDLLATTSAWAHVNRLMKQGYITRARVHKGRGKRYSYKWHETPLEYEKALAKNGLVVAKDLGLPPLPTIDNIRDMFFEYARAHPQLDALEFVFYIEDKIKEVKKQREEIINGHTTSRRPVTMGDASAE